MIVGTPAHVPRQSARVRGGGAGARATADSIPPDAKQDPRWADRDGQRGRQILAAHAENQRHDRRQDRRPDGQGTVGTRGHEAARACKRLLVPSVQLAVAGSVAAIGQLPARLGGTERAAASGFGGSGGWPSVAVGQAGAARLVAVLAEGPGRDLCEHRRTCRQGPNELCSALDHRCHSSHHTTILRRQARRGLRRTRSGPLFPPLQVLQGALTDAASHRRGILADDPFQARRRSDPRRAEPPRRRPARRA